MDQENSKPRRSRKGMSLSKVSINKVNNRLLNALSRDTAHLLIASAEGQLDPAQSRALVDYLKLIQTLKKGEEREAEALSDEALAKIANGDIPKTS